MDVGIRKNLFLIFKEALNNAMKYSQCTEVRISLTRTPGRLVLDITDNGQGFDFLQIKPGNGLNNLRERARSMDATLDIRSAVGEGTRIKLSAPIA
jgi:signal transduction histidine kinase